MEVVDEDAEKPEAWEWALQPSTSPHLSARTEPFFVTVFVTALSLEPPPNSSLKK